MISSKDDEKGQSNRVFGADSLAGGAVSASLGMLKPRFAIDLRQRVGGTNIHTAMASGT